MFEVRFQIIGSDRTIDGVPCAAVPVCGELVQLPAPPTGGEFAVVRFANYRVESRRWFYRYPASALGTMSRLQPHMVVLALSLVPDAPGSHE